VFVFKNAEKELETQMSMRNELEAAKKLMEMSLIEKQELLTRIKEQLEQIKSSSFKTLDALNVNYQIATKFV
jgi:hypothetical protein